jgi:hypothetical protein
MNSFLKGLFYLATMMAWLVSCTIFAIEVLGTGNHHIIRDFPTWFDWTMLIVSLSCCTFSMWSILEVADMPKAKSNQQHQSKTDLIKQELNEAIEKQDYETAARLRDKLHNHTQ